MTIYTDFYVYAYLREDLTPYYIGKGRRYRAFSYHRCGAQRPTDPNRIRIFMKNLSEPDALNWEKHWIKAFGRKDIGTGILGNFTDGGEGISGLVHSEETKNKIGKTQIGKIMSLVSRQKMSDAHKGKTLSPEHKKKMSDAKKGKIPWNKGKPASEEARQKMSDAKKGKVFSPEHRQKIAETKIAKRNKN